MLVAEETELPETRSALEMLDAEDGQRQGLKGDPLENVTLGVVVHGANDSIVSDSRYFFRC